MTDAKRPIDLDRIGVASPCNESWEEMTGDDKVRFCDRCALNVYNLSAMDREEATQLVKGADDRLCVRFFRRHDGKVMTKDCPVGLAAKTGRFLKTMAASLLALVGFLPACSTESRSTQEETSPASTECPETKEAPEIECTQGEMLMGDIAFEAVEPRDEPVRLQGKVRLPPESTPK